MVNCPTCVNFYRDDTRVRNTYRWKKKKEIDALSWRIQGVEKRLEMKRVCGVVEFILTTRTINRTRFFFFSHFSRFVEEKRPPHAPNWRNVSHGSHHCARRAVTRSRRGDSIRLESSRLKLTCIAALAPPRVCQDARLFCSLAFSGWKATWPRPVFSPCRPMASIRTSIWKFQ